MPSRRGDRPGRDGEQAEGRDAWPTGPERDGPDGEEVWVRDGDDTLRRKRGPSPVAAVLGDLARKRRWGRRLEGAAVFGRWEQLVGPELAQRCEPVRLVGGVLVIRAESQAWATQVGYLTGQLTERAEEVLGADLVREVRIVVGPLRETGGSSTDAGEVDRG